MHCPRCTCTNTRPDEGHVRSCDLYLIVFPQTKIYIIVSNANLQRTCYTCNLFFLFCPWPWAVAEIGGGGGDRPRMFGNFWPWDSIYKYSQNICDQFFEQLATEDAILALRGGGGGGGGVAIKLTSTATGAFW